jgi:hypothetical protein
LDYLGKSSRLNDPRFAFGLLFLAVSIAVGFGAIVTEVVILKRLSNYYYGVIWTTCFGLTFGLIFCKFRKPISSIRTRMKSSVLWPTKAKVINGLCWAGPFVAIPMFIHFYQYLILLGIGLGNTSTYLLMRKYNKSDNREQLVVGLISLLAIPVAIGIDSAFFTTRQDIALMTSRVLIAVAYGVGGIYAVTSKG